METLKFRLDPGDHDSVTRVLKAFFGLVCIAAAIVTVVIMSRAGQVTTGNAAATGFLLLFGAWLVLAGFGLTERYVIVSGDTITLKDRIHVPARILKAPDIREIAFSQLKMTFTLVSGEVLPLRLGAYYRENSLLLMEAVETFCELNGVTTRGIEPGRKE
ncbi:MAG: hypothetical protein MUE37_14405 [Bacteroidales bacterium]|nr:hypothetical protein [Bacteroidales bacterium]